MMTSPYPGLDELEVVSAPLLDNPEHPTLHGHHESTKAIHYEPLQQRYAAGNLKQVLEPEPSTLLDKSILCSKFNLKLSFVSVLAAKLCSLMLLL